MTSANVLQTQAGTGQILNANAKNLKIPGIAGVDGTASFSSFIQGTVSQNTDNGDPGRELSGAGPVKNGSYSKRDIAPAETKTAAQKVEDAPDTVAETKEVLVDTVADKLKLDENELTDAMAALGMTAFDLLDPQKLAQLFMQVSGETSQAELLVDPQFVDLMQAVSDIGNDLMGQLGVTADEMDEVIAQMDLLEQPAAVEILKEQNTVSLTEEMPDMSVATGQTAGQRDTLTGEIPQEQDNAGQDVEPVTKEELSSNPVFRSGQEDSSGDETSKDPGAQAGNDAGAQVHRNVTRPVQTELTGSSQNVTVFTETLEAQLSMETPVSESTFSSLNPLDLIEQIAQNVKVSLSQESSSMEMQLNPENLGKIYLQVSAREGSVHATIAAQNEAVKAALESQVAELKESLNQSGVKVDAVEVTVASHEFEKNLEQNEQRQKEEGERQQEQVSRRRNLNLTMPQELEGELSQEEALAAQIMKDNGNSVDLTA